MCGRMAFAEGVASPVGVRWLDDIGTVLVTGARVAACPLTAMTGDIGLEEMGAEGTPEFAGGAPGGALGVTTGYAAAPGVPCLRVFLNSVIARLQA